MEAKHERERRQEEKQRTRTQIWLQGLAWGKKAPEWLCKEVLGLVGGYDVAEVLGKLHVQLHTNGAEPISDQLTKARLAVMAAAQLLKTLQT